MKSVQLKDGRSALNLIPDYSGALAIVSLAVLQKLASYLQRASTASIIDVMRDKLNVLYYEAIDETDSDGVILSKYVQMLEDEVAFHKSVNLITTIKPEELKPELSKAQTAWKDSSDDIDKLVEFARNEHINDVKELFELADKKWGKNIPSKLGNLIWARETKLKLDSEGEGDPLG